MEALIILIFIPLAIGIFFLQSASHENRIHSHIESIGGKVLAIERKHFDTGPFILPGKGRTVYKIKYQIGSQIKEGWAKFGGLFGPDWRL